MQLGNNCIRFKPQVVMWLSVICAIITTKINQDILSLFRLCEKKIETFVNIDKHLDTI